MVLGGSIGVTDYYSLLMRAVGSLEPNTEATRAELFQRARTMLLDKIGADQRWTRAAIEDEVVSFDRAIERIESELAYLDAGPPGRRGPVRGPSETPPSRPPSQP